MTNTPTHLYVGKRDAVMAETGCPGFYEGKYLAYPIGDIGDWDAEGVNSKKDLKTVIACYRAAYPGIAIYYV